MKKQPKLDIPASKLENFLNILAVLLMISSIVYAIYSYGRLPDTIPTHFNVKGEADGWGSKVMLFTLPAIALICFVPMYFLSKFPHVFNYPFKITTENARRMYQEGRLMITMINFSIVLIFTFLVWETVQAADGISIMGEWSVIFILAIIFLPMIYSIVRMYKLK